MHRNCPLALVDLDDTLFQTARKMCERSARFPASVDGAGANSGYMSSVQKQFVEWLLLHADVVPVTARSPEAFGRVRLGFHGRAVCSHGAVILEADGSLDTAWFSAMELALTDYQPRLPELLDTALKLGEEMGFELRGWVVAEGGQRHYVVVKHTNGHDTDLVAVLAAIRARGLLGGLRVHINGNNLALLPGCISKRAAVDRLLEIDRENHGERLVLGFGDSITDLGFMSLCHFWSTPANSQLAKAAQAAIHG